MENEELIRHQMEDTRTSLTEKLETLEQQVVATVQEATSAVSETVATVKESVEETVTSVKDTLQDTVSTVKDSVEGTVSAVQDGVKNALDIPAHVDRYPWFMMGGSVVLGYALGTMFSPRRPPTATPRAGSPRSSSRTHHGNGGVRDGRAGSSPAPVSWVRALGLEPELAKLKGLALGAALGTVREMVIKAVPEEMGHQLKDIIDNVTQKLGGQPIPSSDWAGCPLSSEGEHHDKRDEAEMGRTVGTTHWQDQENMGQRDRR